MKIKIQALVKVIEFIPRSNGPEFKSKTWHGKKTGIFSIKKENI